MRTSIVPLVAAAAMAVVAGSNHAAKADEASRVVMVIDGFQSPESVLIAGDRRFVSNIGKVLDPLAKDGDGYISEVSADGKLVKARAFPAAGETLDAPKGMAAIDGRLYVADIDRIVGFDLTSGARVFEQRVPGNRPALANDLAATADGRLLVTDSLRNAVYRLDPKDGAWTELAAGLPGANGVVVEPRHQRIIVAGIGKNFSGGDVFAIDGSAKPARLDGAPRGLFDGLAALPDGRLLVSDWKAVDRRTAGAILILSADGVPVGEIESGQDIHGPADFALDRDMLWVPAMLDNKVIVIRMAE